MILLGLSYHLFVVYMHHVVCKLLAHVLQQQTKDCSEISSNKTVLIDFCCNFVVEFCQAHALFCVNIYHLILLRYVWFLSIIPYWNSLSFSWFQSVKRKKFAAVCSVVVNSVHKLIMFTLNRGKLMHDISCFLLDFKACHLPAKNHLTSISWVISILSGGYN